jgi:Leucine-rich repeat (LRR) protein
MNLSLFRNIDQLQTLDEISLSTNKLENVSSKWQPEKNLRILIMNNNQLTSLPKEMVNDKLTVFRNRQ